MYTLRISGAIDRSDPDPMAPSDPMSRWVGWASVGWTAGGSAQLSRAAISTTCTGRGVPRGTWGQNVLRLRWIGDLPPVEIAVATYDAVEAGGPDQRILDLVVVAHPVTPQPQAGPQPSKVKQ